MPYTVTSRAGAYGGVGIMARDAAEALARAEEMEQDGRQEVTIRDEAGGLHSVGEFRRVLRGGGLDAEQLRLVQGTCDVLISANSRAADIFYDRLFALAPETRALFDKDLQAQKRKLMETLVSMIGFLTHPEMFGTMVAQLGRRHVAYGAEPRHYGPVGEALLAALADLLGPRFTPEVRAAWTALYLQIADTMLRGRPETAGASDAEPVRG